MNNSGCFAVLSNIIAQVRMEFEFLINSKKFFCSQTFYCKNIDTWIGSDESLDKEFECQLDFDDNFNPSSNNSTIVKCAYFVEFFIRYHKKTIRTVHLKIPFHVNPKHCIRKNYQRVPENWLSLESPTNTFVEESFSFRFNDDLSLL